MNLEPQYTQDGSVTLLNTELNAAYHSRFGAVQESTCIYVNAGLLHAAQTFGNHLRVLEMGFGTGLNAWLSWQASLQHQLKIHYTAIEKYPVPATLYPTLNYTQSLTEQQHFDSLLNCPWEQPCALGAHFTLLKQQGDVNSLEFPDGLQVVYYDAFDPVAAPECWQAAIFERLFSAMLPGGCLVTFCAKGHIKRLLKQTGFKVEALPGPPGKREMTRAIKQ